MNVQTTAARARAQGIMARAESTNNSHRSLLDVVREGPDRRKVKDERTEARRVVTTAAGPLALAPHRRPRYGTWAGLASAVE